MAKRAARERVSIPVTEGSANAFADPGVAEPEEELPKPQLASHIRHTIKRGRLTQLQAAQPMGLDRPKVSALMNGRLAGFSSHRLMRFLTARVRRRRRKWQRLPKTGIIVAKSTGGTGIGAAPLPHGIARRSFGPRA